MTAFSCRDKIDQNVVYREKSVDVIRQLLSDESYNYVVEIPNESTITTLRKENPIFNNDESLIKRIGFLNKRELDSAEKALNHVFLDTIFLREKKIPFISNTELERLEKRRFNPKQRYLFISKPIFNPTFTKAFINYGFGTCLSIPPAIYNLEKGSWVRK